MSGATPRSSAPTTCCPATSPFYEWSLKLWEGLEQDINYNAMVSQRGVLNLCHSDAQRDAYARRGNAMRLRRCIDAELLDREQVRQMVPFLDFDNGRFPIRAACCSAAAAPCAMTRSPGAMPARRCPRRRPRSRTARSPASARGGRVVGVETTRGFIGAGKVGLAVAGNSGRVAGMAGLRLPIESHVLQAFVSEALKPLIDTVVTYGAGHFYISQSDKGGLVFGGDIDGYNSYAQRGNLAIIEDVAECAMGLWPGLGRVRLLRHWGGVMDMSMDGSPIIDRTGIDGLYLNAGWCYGGFKATPASGWCFAHLIARDTPHEVATAYRLDRFATGRLIDEKGAGAQPNLH
jgi:heterotetrameric sarcosine oxidase beta subunit